MLFHVSLLKQINYRIVEYSHSREGFQKGKDTPRLDANIARLGLVRDTLLSVLNGTDLEVVLSADELVGKDRAARFDPNRVEEPDVPAAERGWWRGYRASFDERLGTLEYPEEKGR